LANAVTLGDLAGYLGGELIGDPQRRVSRVAPLESAGDGDLSFVAGRRYRALARTSAATALLVSAADRGIADTARIVVDDPYAQYARAVALLYPEPAPAPGVAASAHVDPKARVAASASIGPHCHVGVGASIGERVRLVAAVRVLEQVSIGEDSILFPGVTVYPGCRIGRRARLHAGAVIGADGFGYAPYRGAWIRIPQIGAVLIGDDVEIGANTTVDRGALADTVIEDGVKLDNQIQVGHNVRIGAHTAIAGCVGIAGSARIGRRCRIGGAAGILGHIEIADDVEISPYTLVTRSVRVPGKYTGYVPFDGHRDWLANAAHWRQLSRQAERIEQLEAIVEQLRKGGP
jgi:UDP-3-O-[3-hydroxymyristoyl] glucosamine N-acyltransferase